MIPLLVLLLACDGKLPADDSAPPCAGDLFQDADGDGFGDPSAPMDGCDPTAGAVANADDCDDADAAIHPGASEPCGSEADHDCDGRTGDEDADGDGVVACLDCDDADATVLPGATERCDGVDGDCDGTIDDDPADGATWYVDADGDGAGEATTTLLACEQPAGFAATADDCDDADGAVFPLASELCNGDDDDCDGTVDEDAVDVLAWYDDGDGDGFGFAPTRVDACEAPAGFVDNDADCNDRNALIYPAAGETCDGADEDCDGLVDEAGAAGEQRWYPDADGDGWGSRAGAGIRACAPPAGHVPNDGDCDDRNADVYSGADEVCGGGDEDCDGVIDESDAVDAPTWYGDMDGDSHGTAAVTVRACDPPADYAATADDCDDVDSRVFPGATEVCNRADDDCDGGVDESATGGPTWYADADGDGYGDPAVAAASCFRPDGYVSDDSDCDDTAIVVSPAATETCNAVDDDCDGVVDEGDASDAVAWYADADGDGYGESGTSVVACEAPAGYAADDADCDDADADVFPGAAESCAGATDANCDGRVGLDDDDGDGWAACKECDDGDAGVFPGGLETCNRVDDDCDGVVDDGVTPTWYADADGDGSGDPAVTAETCAMPAGFVAADTDCDDGNGAIRPGAVESCLTTTDDDCDGATNAEDATGCREYYYDDDGDGYGNSAHACLCEGEGLVTALTGDDCDDGDAALNPAAFDDWGNRVDEDCDDATDRVDLAGAGYRVTARSSSIQLGSSLAYAGDVDGDGADDLVVGATRTPNGAAYMVYGPLTADRVLGGGDTVFEGEADGDQAGTSVAGAGDADGDGYDDVLVGAYLAGTPSAGRAYLVYGPFAAIESLAAADGIYTGAAGSDRCGWSVAFAGDTDGDGYDDMLVGCPYNDDVASTAGAAYLVRGPGNVSLTLTSADATLLGEARSDQAGLAVGGGHDLDGDGLDDVVVGANENDTGASSAGAAYVLLGPIVGTVSLAAADARFAGEYAGDYVGYSVSTADDLDADGRDDVVVGGNGVAYVVPGGTLGANRIVDVALVSLEPSAAGSNTFGLSAAVVGDIDGDGFPDMVAGEPYSNAYALSGGCAWLFAGPLVGVLAADDAASSFCGTAYGGEAGRDVSAAGDLDGDGLPDFAVGEKDGGDAVDSGVVTVVAGR